MLPLDKRLDLELDNARAVLRAAGLADDVDFVPLSALGRICAVTTARDRAPKSPLCGSLLVKHGKLAATWSATGRRRIVAIEELARFLAAIDAQPRAIV